jgi:putative NIF3 family GTP cyclohydrolase 1 type 2
MAGKETESGMGRREFIYTAPGVAAAMAAVGSTAAQQDELTAGDVRKYLMDLDGGWVKRGDTVDTFKSGSAQSPVRGIAVAWMPYTWALKRARELSCDLFVTHEPTYYNHRDNDESIFRFGAVRQKREFIESSGITILRCHDMWDQFPDEGIPMAWGKLLELGEPIEGGGYFYVYDGKGSRAVALARAIARRVASMGQPGIQFIGDGDRPVKRLVVGCGAITPMLEFIDNYKADMAVCSDDGFTYWRDGAFAIDTGFPVAVVNHPVTEEYGVKLLAARLKQQFPQVPVHYIPQNCMYKIYTA